MNRSPLKVAQILIAQSAVERKNERRIDRRRTPFQCLLVKQFYLFGREPRIHGLRDLQLELLPPAHRARSVSAWLLKNSAMLFGDAFSFQPHSLSRGPESSASAGGGRWSAKRKVSVILELLRGADLESTSRKYPVTAATLEWRDRFLAGGEAGLKTRETDVDDEERRRLKSVVATSASKTNCCARRSPVWRIAALWHSGGRNREPHHFAFQQTSLWCGSRGRCLEPGAIDFLCRSAASAGPQGATEAWTKVHTDEELIAEIRKLLAEPVFTGEGYQKIWARLRHKDVRTSKDRVLRLLREHQLLSPARQPEPRRGNPHERTIVTEAPNQMWGTDATATFTEAEGTVTICCD